jgi:hypothetical protein
MAKNFREAVNELIEDVKKEGVYDQASYYILKNTETGEYDWTYEYGYSYPDWGEDWEIVASTYRGEDEEGYYGATLKSVIWAIRDMRKDYYEELRNEKLERKRERLLEKAKEENKNILVRMYKTRRVWKFDDWYVDIVWEVACPDGKIRWVSEDDAWADFDYGYDFRSKEIPDWVEEEIEKQIQWEKEELEKAKQKAKQKEELEKAKQVN